MMLQRSFFNQKQLLPHIGVLILILSVYCFNLLATPFHPDEASWIATSDVFEAFYKLEFNSPVWDPGDWRSGKKDGEVYVPIVTNSTITRYFIGFSRKLGGISREELNRPWHFGSTTEQNIQQNRKPSDELLWWSRLPMAILASLAIFILYFLLYDAFGIATAIAWILFAITNQYFILSFRRAMDEAPLFMGMALILFCSSHLLRKYEATINPVSWLEGKYLWIGFLGLAIGFTGGAKLNGITTILIGITLIFISHFKKPISWANRLKSSVIDASLLSAVSYFSFILPNYYLLKHPVTGVIEMLKYRTWLMPIQKQWVNEALKIEPENILPFLNKAIFVNYAAIKDLGWLNITLTLIGFIVCCMLTIRWLQGKTSQSAYIVLVTASLIFSAPVFFIHINLDRYYLLPVLFSTIFISISIGRIFNQQAGSV